MGKKKESPADAGADQVVEVDPFADLDYPVVALVRKYADAVPVEVKDRAHLDRLMAEHGAASVEVQK